MDSLVSLDPRVNRMDIPTEIPLETHKDDIDQLVTFQVFHQMRPGKPYLHVGIVHASDVEMGFIYAKEVFSRRQSCSGLWIIDTTKIFSSNVTEGDESVYDTIESVTTDSQLRCEPYEIFHLEKRGRQHVHAFNVLASSPEHALMKAKEQYTEEKIIYNIWIARDKDFYRNRSEDRDIWSTLSNKQYREPTDYKAGDKLKLFKAKHAQPDK
jgi:ring-1,2-phenylacetyl-CoA epoxidase subunit PaaB